MWWLCLIRSRFRTITWAVKGSPDYFHHPYNPLSWLILCCLCPCSPTREDMGFFSTSWLINGVHYLCLFPWGQEGKQHHLCHPAWDCFFHGIEVRICAKHCQVSLVRAAVSVWPGRVLVVQMSLSGLVCVLAGQGVFPIGWCDLMVSLLCGNTPFPDFQGYCKWLVKRRSCSEVGHTSK